LLAARIDSDLLTTCRGEVDRYMLALVGVVVVRLMEGKDDCRTSARQEEGGSWSNCVARSIDVATPKLRPQGCAEQVQTLVISGLVSLVMIPGHEHRANPNRVWMRI